MRISDWSSDVCSSDLVAAAAVAFEGVAAGEQAFQRFAVVRIAVALAQDRAVGNQPEAFQRVQLVVSGAGDLPRRVPILDAHKPTRKRVVSGRSGAVRLVLGGGWII